MVDVNVHAKREINRVNEIANRRQQMKREFIP